MDKGSGKRDGGLRFWDYAREHPGFALSACYLLVSAIGMYYTWYTFMQFGVNIFDYANTDDYFVAALKKPMLTGACVLFVVGHWWFVRWSERSEDNSLVDRYLKVPFFLGVSAMVIATVFVVESLEDVNGLICSDAGEFVVTLRQPVETKRMVVVGTTSKWVLGFEAADRKDRCGDDGMIAESRPPLLGVPHSEVRQNEYVRPVKVVEQTRVDGGQVPTGDGLEN